MIGFPVGHRHRVGRHLRAHALEGQASMLRFTLLLLHPLSGPEGTAEYIHP